MSWLRYLWDPNVWWERRQRKLQATGATECGLRIVSGSQEGLGAKWKHGIARVHSGYLEFLPRIGGSRVARPRQPWIRIAVMDASRAHERTATGGESWSVNPTARIVVLHTREAELEWALTPEQRDWALARLRGVDT